MFLPVSIGLGMLLKAGMSNKVAIIPSKIPICDPRPKERSMVKNKILQNGAPGSLVKTSAITIKANPVPSAASFKYSTRLQFFKVLSPVNTWFINVSLRLITCEFIKPVYSSAVISCIPFPCQTSVWAKIKVKSLLKHLSNKCWALNPKMPKITAHA